MSEDLLKVKNILLARGCSKRTISNKFLSFLKQEDFIFPEIKCPNCKQTLLVKTNRLQQCEFKDNLQLLDKVEDTFILRTFELYFTYNRFYTTHKITEFVSCKNIFSVLIYYYREV